jgi:PAS domain S-box-containing protein
MESLPHAPVRLVRQRVEVQNLIGLTAIHNKRYRRLALAWLLPLLVGLLQWQFWPHFESSPYILFFPVLLFAPLVGGLWGGIGAALISTLLMWYIFLPPQFAWELNKVSSSLSLLVFVATGFATAWFVQRLRNSEDKYRTLFNRAGEGIVVVDRRRRVVDANPAMCALVGAERKQMIGMHLTDFLADHTPQHWVRVDREIDYHGEAVVEHQMRRTDGSLQTIEAIVTHLAGRQHLAFVHSVEERKRLEHALRASEERLRHALDASNEGMWEWNLATGEAFANDLWFTQLGYAPGEITPSEQVWLDTVHPLDAAATQKAVDDFLQGKIEDSRQEYRIITKSGEVRWMRSVGKIVARAADGNPLRMVGTNTDVTGAKRAEQQLRDSEERFRLVVENSPNAIVIWDESGTLRYASRAIQNAVGISPEQVIASAAAAQASAAEGSGVQHPSAVTPRGASSYPQARQAWQNVLQTVHYCIRNPGQTVQTEEHFPTPLGENRDLLVISQGFQRSGAGCEVVTIVHDMTEHRMFQRVLQQANAALEQQVATRTLELETTVAELRRAHVGKDAFMAAVSHELRTPLTGILSMAELLQSEERGVLNDEQAKYVATLLGSGQRLLTTVNSVLLYTSLVAGTTPVAIETCHLNELCAIAIRAAKPLAAAKQQTMTQVFSPHTPPIESDPQGIVQIVKELLVNAVKFTPAGGCIELAVAPLETGRGVALAVADTGIGLSQEQLATIFAPFTQGDQTLARRFEGIGLGLAYVHEMAHRLGGAVTVASEPDCGSRFTVTLPLRLALPDAAADKPGQGSSKLTSTRSTC